MTPEVQETVADLQRRVDDLEKALRHARAVAQAEHAAADAARESAARAWCVGMGGLVGRRRDDERS